MAREMWRRIEAGQDVREAIGVFVRLVRDEPLRTSRPRKSRKKPAIEVVWGARRPAATPLVEVKVVSSAGGPQISPKTKKTAAERAAGKAAAARKKGAR